MGKPARHLRAQSHPAPEGRTNRKKLPLVPEPRSFLNRVGILRSARTSQDLQVASSTPRTERLRYPLQRQEESSGLPPEPEAGRPCDRRPARSRHRQLPLQTPQKSFQEVRTPQADGSQTHPEAARHRQLHQVPARRALAGSHHRRQACGRDQGYQEVVQHEGRGGHPR